jgi:integrase
VLYRPTYRDPKTGEKKASRLWWYEFSFRGARIRESSGFASKTQAREAERKRRADLRQGFVGLRRREPKLFRIAAAEYLAIKRPTLSAGSYRIEKQSITHLLPHFGGRLTSDVEAADVARYQEARRSNGAANGTINLEVGTLRAILRRAGVWSLIQTDVRMLRERDDAGKALTEEEEKRLLAECLQSRSRALYPAVVLALNTGLRYGELAGLRWRQVDLEGRKLTVGDSKTRAGEGRVVPLNDRAYSVLAMWSDRFPDRRSQHFAFPAEKYGEGGSVYAQAPDKPMGDLKEAWEAAKRRTGDKEKEIPAVVCRWHDLRHTFATRILERGTGLSVAAVIMGWSPATAARMAKRYGHISTDILRSAVGLLDEREIAETSQRIPQSEEEATSALVAN